MNTKEYKKHVRSLSKKDLKEQLEKQLKVVIDKYFNYLESQTDEQAGWRYDGFVNTLNPLETALQALKEVS